MLPDSMRCFLVEKRDNSVAGRVTTHPTAELPAGDVLIRVQFSSLNYKDALAAGGHPGVAPNLPHVPGIDAVGKVVASSDPRFQPGHVVLATSFEIGAGRWGAYAEYLRVPGDWVLPLPEGLTRRESMILGTAGLTAAMCLEALQERGITPGAGEVLVTGASGGVGTIAVAILAQLGYEVVAVSGKPAAHELLKRLGAARILGRDEVLDSSTRPLFKSRLVRGHRYRRRKNAGDGCSFAQAERHRRGLRARGRDRLAVDHLSVHFARSAIGWYRLGLVPTRKADCIVEQSWRCMETALARRNHHRDYACATAGKDRGDSGGRKRWPGRSASDVAVGLVPSDHLSLPLQASELLLGRVRRRSRRQLGGNSLRWPPPWARRRRRRASRRPPVA